MVSAALIGLLIHRVNWHGLAVSLAHVNVLGAIGTSFLTPAFISLLALRWKLLLRQQAIAISFADVFRLTWAGQFFNSVLPGSTGGDVVKVYQLCRMFPMQKAAAVTTVIVDRLTALIALSILAAFGLWQGPRLSLDQLGISFREHLGWLVFISVLGGLSMFTVFLFFAISANWRAKVAHMLPVLRNSLQPSRTSITVLVLAFGVHLLNFTIFFAFSRCLGIRLSYGQALMVMPVVLMVLLVPVTVNGHGLREMLLIFYFTALHITWVNPGVGIVELVVSLSVLSVTNDLLWCLPGGIWYFARRDQPGMLVHTK